MAESEEELKSVLIKVKEENEKAGLKLNIQKTKIMVSYPITPWQIDGETMETVTDFTFLGSKITPDDDCTHEIKRRFLLGRKAMTNLESILKSRNVTLPTKVRLVKAMVFPVVMYGCESWTVKKAERRELMLLNCGVGEDSWVTWGYAGLGVSSVARAGLELETWSGSRHPTSFGVGGPLWHPHRAALQELSPRYPISSSLDRQTQS